jgi:hypothetical protein
VFVAHGCPRTTKRGTGENLASVIIPKPSKAFAAASDSRCCSPFLRAASSSAAFRFSFCVFMTPIPNASKTGTDTTPVANVPQSQARPSRGRSSRSPLKIWQSVPSLAQHRRSIDADQDKMAQFMKANCAIARNKDCWACIAHSCKTIADALHSNKSHHHM